MDECVRSGVIKKKSSSGCLIIKKKDGSKNSGASEGFSSGKEKKRPRLAASYSGSSDEDESLEFMKRKVIDKRISGGSMGYGGIEITGQKKNNRLDLFEFDEYDEFDGEKMRNDHYSENRFKMVAHSGSGNFKKFGVGPSNRNEGIEKRKHGQYFDGSSAGRSKGRVGDQGLQLEDDETHMPISLLKLKYQETANEPVRFQGKNGVLKVMVNKKKKIDLTSHHKSYDHRTVEERKGYRSENAVKKDELVRLPLYSDPKLPEKQGLFENSRSAKKDKKGAIFKRAKPSVTEGSKARDLAIDGTDTTLKLAPPGSQASSSKKGGSKKEEERFSSPVKVTPVRGKEAKGEKSKRGGSTEKQMLREKIRKMLVDAGWIIDYRPRRNRDYLDAVYISPSGTAYWSIIKAYDAFRKQLEEDGDKSKVDVGSPSFTPLSEDLLNKLTRQTKKRIKEEMKKKRKVDQESGDDLSDESLKRKPRKIRSEQSSLIFGSSVVQGRTSKIIGRCTLLARGSDKGESSYSDGYVPYKGKRTVLSWLIDSGAAKLSEKVQYMNRRRNRVMLEGWITKDGIHCGCCSKILTVSKFELHAGSKLRQPFQNIILESGVSLLQCQIDAWNKQEDSVRQDFYSIDVDGGDPDDDTCSICGDGGDLICCDSCPSTFHQVCLEIQILPSGDWHCPNCTCKYCGDTRGNVTLDSDKATDEPIKCSFCEKKYHRSCREKVFAASLSSNNASICGPNCQEIYDHLQKLLGVKHELEAGFSWSLIQRMDVSDTSHRNFPQRVECNSKLAVALSVMNECFLPIFDRRSGINMMHNVVYNCGSNFNRLNYRGFYTAILERGDELISAASIRIHGTRLAEMPFIGTREIYRRQGMCRRLLSAIETALVSLGVEKLIIPAISEHMNTWMTVFSFHLLEDTLKKEIKSMNMLVFPGTDMLQKQLIKKEISEGVTGPELNKNRIQHPVLLENPLADSSLEDSERAEDDSGACHETNLDENVGALDSDSPASAFPCSDPASTSAPDALCEPDKRLACKGTTVTLSDSEISKGQIESSTGLKCNISCSENPSTPVDNANSSINDSLDESLDKAEVNGNLKPINSSGEEVAEVEDSVDSSVKISEDSFPETIVTDCSIKSLPAAKVEDSVDSSVKISEDAAPGTIVTDCFVKSLPASTLEPSIKNTTVNANGESNSASAVVNHDPSVQSDACLNQPTLPIMKNVPNLFIEASTGAIAATNAKIDVIRGVVDSSTITDTSDDKINDLSPACTKEDKENVRVSGVRIASAEEINENQNPAPNSTVLDSGESEVKNNMVSGIAQKEVATCSETDKSNGEIESPHAVNVEVFCPITSHEHLALNTATTENMPESSGISDSNHLQP
ncbi:uncharacterized protein [Primulina huaijiensis]|uniref:uncharacterized protein isoform X1 n=1 Tax=Primulina huaijiensis TaxID=1492673 RepID=UPI003CC7081D